MEKYDYREAVTEEIVEYIKQDFDLKDYAGRREALKDDVKENVAMEVSRSYVGSYTCDAPTARRNLEGNEELLLSAFSVLDIEEHLPHVNGRLVDTEDIVKYIEDPEKADMYIREALAVDCVEEAVKKIEEELDIDLDDDRTFSYAETIILKDEIPEETFSDIQSICESAEIDKKGNLVLPDVTIQEVSEITSCLEYEDINFDIASEVAERPVKNKTSQEYPDMDK